MSCNLSLSIVLLRHPQRFRFPDIKPLEALERITLYSRLPANGQVEGDDRELPRPFLLIHITEEGRGDDVYAAKSQLLKGAFVVCEISRFYLSGSFVDPTVQVVLLIE